MPKAFVIMPFDPELEPVYTRFLQPILTENGFDVKRADDIDSQRNILQDIVQAIYESDLIVADLTGNNPNVFYELGIAHAFRKPVILSTQSIEDVPFDLRPYRLLLYSTHFGYINEAEEQLRRYATDFMQGLLRFGNPITDFFHAEQPASSSGSHDISEAATPKGVDRLTSERSSPNQSMDTDDRGLFDHFVDIQQGYSRVAEVTAATTGSLNDLTGYLERTTARINEISASPDASSPQEIILICRRLASRVGTFTDQVRSANGVYAEVLDNTQDSLEQLVSAQLDLNDGDQSNILEQIASMEFLRDQATFARDSILLVATLMDGLPRLERRLNRELDRSSKEIQKWASNIDRLIASTTRAINAGRGPLDHSNVSE